MFICLAFYPGYMSQDSLSQYQQAKNFSFLNITPPVMSLVWHFTDKLIPGPLGMMVFHNLLFFSAVVLLIGTHFSKSKFAFLLLPLVGLWPPIAVWLGTLWKDTSMFSAFLLAYAFILRALKTRSNFVWFLSLLALLYASSVRHNALPAALPFCYLLSRYWIRKRGLIQCFKRVTATILTVIGLFGFTKGVEKLLCSNTEFYLQQYLINFDLAGIVVRSHDPQLLNNMSEAYQRPLTFEWVSKLYEPWDHFKLATGDAELKLLDLPVIFKATQNQKMEKLWFSAVITHPFAYLRHRIAVCSYLLGISAPAYYPYHPWGIDANAYGFVKTNSYLNHKIMAFLRVCSKWPPFQGFYYLIFIIYLLSLDLTVRAKLKRLPLNSSALVWSGAIAFFCNSIMLPGAEFRYFSWTLVAGWVAILFYFFQQFFYRKTELNKFYLSQ